MTGSGGTRGREPESRPAPSVLALAVLTAVLGMQFLRIFVPGLLFYLGPVVGVSTVQMGLVGAAVFLSGMLAAPLARLLGLRGALVLAAGGVALLRAIEQLSVSPGLDFVLSAGGLALFVIFVPLVLGGMRPGGPRHTATLALAMLLGVATDGALHIAAGTYDLTWQQGLWPLLLVLALALLLLLALVAAVTRLPRAPVDVSWRRAWSLMAFGPWLALQVIVFQNAARTAAVSGWSLPAAGFVVTAGNILGLLLAAWPADGWPRWAAVSAGVVLVLVSWPTEAAGLAAALLVIAGQAAASLLLVRAFGASVPAGPGERGLGRTVAAYGVGQLLLTVLFFAYNAAHDLALPFTEVMVVPFMALFLALPAVLPGGAVRVQEARAERGWRAVAFLLALGLLLLAPVWLALSWQESRLPAPPNAGDILRVLDYNLHNGFDVTGRLDMEALAEVIEGSGADVVALQEVSRGWVVAGSLDMLAWLAQRLDMEVASGPTMSDRQWGNAILSRYPIVETTAVTLPSEGLPLRRGYVQIEVGTATGPVRVISTHLHHIAEEGAVREVQAEALLGRWDNAPRTIIAGDFNARPGDREIEMLVEAGLIDAVAALSDEPVYTSPADAPVQRIDYIFLSPDLVPESFEVYQTTASDHFPLLAVVRLP